ncbi:TBC domain containing protein [Trichomonas vaginalis G3]|uniref:TBC domain containing protein n=1 Tax=Trichomonas vaginalis (strain ATCC PRA-98 / G3) TaxID=412133 RepID=A2E463_TRIV3|nr:regulation of vesicle fusion [Trichomonas vaginalis G3]EAY12509.1 TBC domain containing protein [Trichomonas vaginalis G3]KAI5554046.1 regulation of vesicle fusion [Trichomonas vaginalis G3]|eukprot:XP_001324732.1 TBC domain containing protein [Trichomonas vaginalis G3]
MFLEILDDDVLVDKEKLMAASYYGVPDAVRAKVWMHLLNVSDSSHHFEGQQVVERTKYYKSLRPTTFPYIKNAVNTVIHHMALTEENISAGLSNILCNYFSCNPNVHFNMGIVSLTVPLFIASENDEVSSFFLLTNLLDRWYFQNSDDIHIKQAAKLAKYISIFYPDLANHFSSEALDMSEIFIHWFQFYHSTALPIQSLLRLWDTYLSLDAEHLRKTTLFVSLALVERLMPKILRMEHIEIKNFLSHLPFIDIDVLLVQAQTMQSQFAAMFASEKSSQ